MDSTDPDITMHSIYTFLKFIYFLLNATNLYPNLHCQDMDVSRETRLEWKKQPMSLMEQILDFHPPIPTVNIKAWSFE